MRKKNIPNSDAPIDSISAKAPERFLLASIRKGDGCLRCYVGHRRRLGPTAWWSTNGLWVLALGSGIAEVAMLAGFEVVLRSRKQESAVSMVGAITKRIIVRE